MKKLKKIIASTLIFTSIFSTTVLAKEASEELNLIGTSAISVDLETNDIIYAKNIDNQMFPASVTKLMTALLLAENKQKNDLLTYPKEALNEAPFSYGLNVHPVTPGDTFTAANAMDILLLYSGNDIAYMIAKNIGGTVDNFVKMMNDKAKELKMTNTHFVTPNGLDDNINDHLTTSYDLSILLKAVMDNEWTSSILGKKESEVKSTNGPTAKVENRNKILGENGNIGGKTGYTEKAGRCLAAVYERDGRKIATVVLNSEYNLPEDSKVFEDVAKLADYSYNAEKKSLLAKDTELESKTLKYKVFPLLGPERTIRVPVTVKEDVLAYETSLEPEIKYELNDGSAWKLNKNKPIGKVTVKIKDTTNQYDLYPTISKMDLVKQNILIYIVVLAIITALIVIILKFINKRKDRKRRSVRFYR
ncbi:D-alanyl-D-alanine carboxypeptidase family protein [Clostridium senegalense]|uniref:D-alanyl-D-alanine carboxypeptidase family protein n=1 Tax=Clostridium senegalense TaxID=1465809 RepID=UPI001C1274E9|nr:D-alanyl-D-alanine carboxypeptidase family protein [Clostridium senegalense]MBU5227123.1 D-alanyl-D-alanine carboxypeptidase [Clostridium senegalense]